MRKSATAIAAAVLASAATACGGGDDSEQLSAEELVSRGDGICADGAERFAEVQSEPPRNASEAESQTSELVEIATDELNDLRALRPPDELRNPYDAYLASRASALELLEEGRDAAAGKDADAYAKAQAEATADQAERLRLARAVGFKSCSKPAG